jgi:hypothetical protein
MSENYPFVKIADCRANCINRIREIVVQGILDKHLASCVINIGTIVAECEAEVKKMVEAWREKQNPNSAMRVYEMNIPVKDWNHLELTYDGD